MPAPFANLEISYQQWPTASPEDLAVNARRYFMADLALLAPQLDENLEEDTHHLFSNDECSVPYMQQLQVREATPEYQHAANPVALLVGESALAATVHLIPESTIVLLDVNPGMCEFMQRYVDSLRTASNSEAWRSEITINDRAGGQLAKQLRYWQALKIAHPAASDEAFAVAQAAIRRKTIVTWNGDIGSPDDMRYLAQALSERNAQITFLNLNNVLLNNWHYVADNEGWLWLPFKKRRYLHSKEATEALRLLPISDSAPILTTSNADPKASKPNNRPLSRSGLVQTGPFFGIENLACAGWMDDPHNSLVWRQYVEPQSDE